MFSFFTKRWYATQPATSESRAISHQPMYYDTNWGNRQIIQPTMASIEMPSHRSLPQPTDAPQPTPGAELGGYGGAQLPRCYICHDTDDTIIKSDCKCNELYYHDSCIKLLNDDSYVCMICNGIIKEFSYSEEEESAIRTIILNNYGYIKPFILVRCRRLLSDIDVCKKIINTNPSGSVLFSYFSENIKRVPEMIDYAIKTNNFDKLPDDIVSDITICKNAISYNVFFATQMSEIIRNNPEIEELINEICIKIAKKEQNHHPSFRFDYDVVTQNHHSAFRFNSNVDYNVVTQINNKIIKYSELYNTAGENSEQPPVNKFNTKFKSFLAKNKNIICNTFNIMMVYGSIHIHNILIGSTISDFNIVKSFAIAICAYYICGWLSQKYNNLFSYIQPMFYASPVISVIAQTAHATF